jgi:hypothetical protein
MAVGIRHADHVAPSFRKTLAITSPTSGGHSAGIVRSRTQTMEFSFSLGSVECQHLLVDEIRVDDMSACYAWQTWCVYSLYRLVSEPNPVSLVR